MNRQTQLPFPDSGEQPTQLFILPIRLSDKPGEVSAIDRESLATGSPGAILPPPLADMLPPCNLASMVPVNFFPSAPFTVAYRFITNFKVVTIHLTGTKKSAVDQSRA